ncbi:unnamed protein product [Nesidiocoris tenuis]|uniref:Uncharacterized protein n=1 Tax=Nesidiocoris tenuis TaxID=355587 RepID=A0A6H5GY73_9HEMI|nr:unnamed protein product [Nesidiocoris tenuis]
MSNKKNAVNDVFISELPKIFDYRLNVKFFTSSGQNTNTLCLKFTHKNVEVLYMKNEELSKPPFQASASCPVTEVASGVPCRPRGDGQNQSRHVPLASQFSLHTEIKIKELEKEAFQELLPFHTNLTSVLDKLASRTADNEKSDLRVPEWTEQLEDRPAEGKKSVLLKRDRYMSLSSPRGRPHCLFSSCRFLTRRVHTFVHLTH